MFGLSVPGEVDPLRRGVFVGVGHGIQQYYSIYSYTVKSCLFVHSGVLDVMHAAVEERGPKPRAKG